MLLAEVRAALAPAPGDTLLDCTAGHGGHSSDLASTLGADGHCVLMDLDAGNLTSATTRLRAMPTPPSIHALHASFAEAPHRLATADLPANMLLADLGFASSQVDDATRGLSFMREGPLDMRLNPAAGITAAQLVASASEAELERVIREWGEDRNARKIARAIVTARATGPITTTTQLAEIIRTAVPRHFSDTIDPATRTFQALRIAVNDELGHLDALLDAIRTAASSPNPSWLAPAARIAIITFHSLEDRPVKQVFTALCREGLATEIGPQPVTASEAEIAANPRARSAKLRAIRLCTLA